MDLSEFRKEYTSKGLHRNEVDPHPMKQFDLWFQQAVSCDLHEPNAMSLATVDTDCRPLLRTVLLKYYDENGFVFFTNYESRKAQHIAANSAVSLLFPWITLERQVIVQGHAEKISAAESLKYFISRPHESQLGAWVSQQSSVISSRKVLMEKLHELKDKFQAGKVPLPSFWGGYRVIPQSIEFWQGGAARLHDRLLYTHDTDSAWKINRLSP